MKNYYEILGVPDNASQDEIKKIYRSLSKTYHPDVYVSDKSFAERKFQDINEAYDVLSNISKRKKFDESLKNKSKNQHFYKKSKSNYEDLKKIIPKMRIRVQMKTLTKITNKNPIIKIIKNNIIPQKKMIN